MATLPGSTTKTFEISSTSIFLASCRKYSQLSPQNSPPSSFKLLSQQSPLHSFPPDFPQSKRIPKTHFVVDGFRFSGAFSICYFLSHFHSDHYCGLSPNWSRGLIFCSQTTARLLVESLNVSELFIIPLALRERVRIDGCEVTFIDANHCPGAIQILVKTFGIHGVDERYVHTGDMRFCDSMKREPVLREFISADAVFLDTTYCNPKFAFPSQEDSVEYIVRTIERIRVENAGALKNVLFLVSAYVVGKERILVAISDRCNCLVHVDSRKMAILGSLGFAESGVFTTDDSASNVHVVGWNVLGEAWPYFRPNFTNMKKIMTEKGYTKAVGFVPTGWVYEARKDGFSVRIKESLEIHLVPYSEHSSYDELREYVKFLRPKQIVPTVGFDVEKLDSRHAQTMNKHFVGLVDEMANKRNFLMAFYPATPNATGLMDEVAEENQEVSIDVDSTVVVADTLVHSEARNISDSPSSQKEKMCNPNTQSDEDIEENMKELCNYLPTWVTSDQISSLLARSGGDIVEAVSDFYEHETEFHEQVVSQKLPISVEIPATISVTSSQTNSAHNSGPLLELGYASSVQEGTPCAGLGGTLGLHKKSSNLKNSFSSKQKRACAEHRQKKKARLLSSLEFSDSKQSTITKFFGKVEPDASQGDCKQSKTTIFLGKTLPGDAPQVGGIGSSLEEQCQNMLLNDTVAHEKELAQFLHILDGSVSRDLAVSVLEKAKGDIGLALNIYYSDSNGFVGDVGNAKNVCEKVICLTEDANSFSVMLPLEKYSPIEHVFWSAGQPAPYLHLSRTFDLVEQEKSRIKISSMLCNMFRSLIASSPEDVLPAVYLCTNRIAADYENMELNIGGSLVTAALEEVCGAKKSTIRDIYNKLGDLGDVAQACRQKQLLLDRPRPLSIREVFSVLRQISTEGGSGSAVRKKNLMINLMRSCQEKEIKFLVRTLVRTLRIGAMMRTILPALAQAVVLNDSLHLLHGGSLAFLKPKLQCISAAVVEAYNILPNLDLLVPSLLSNGSEFCPTTLSMKPGIPIRPMLAKIANGVSQSLKLFQDRAFTCEYKYDGQRAQIHKLKDGTVHIFSRNGEEITSRFPDLIKIIKESCKPAASTFILDAEVVAVDRKNKNRILPFQQLSSRERGGKESSIQIDRIKVDICVFVFDIMFANGEQLLVFPLRQRRTYLKGLLCDKRLGYFEFAKEMTVEAIDACVETLATLAKMNAFLEDAFSSSCEGIIVKSLDVDAEYAASKRTDRWLKVKRDYIEGLNDTLDLVPIGAWHGNGRKAGWFSPFLMACYNLDSEEFQSVCRVMSGFSNSFYVEMKEFFSGERILSKKPPYYQTDEVPDVWFSPELVWEIRGADFTLSPVHQAAIGLVHPSRGISIRFPRFIRTVTDRRPEDCSTAADIAGMYQSQIRKMEVSTN